MAIDARQSGIRLPPDIAGTLQDFFAVTTYPMRVATPLGRLADDAWTAANAARDYFATGNWRTAASGFAGYGYGAFMERTLRPLGSGFSQTAGAIMGGAFQSAVDDPSKPPN